MERLLLCTSMRPPPDGEDRVTHFRLLTLKAMGVRPEPRIGRLTWPGRSRQVTESASKIKNKTALFLKILFFFLSCASCATSGCEYTYKYKWAPPSPLSYHQLFFTRPFFLHKPTNPLFLPDVTSMKSRRSVFQPFCLGTRSGSFACVRL